MAKIANFFLGAVLGAIFGSLVSILLAPSSGTELQDHMKGYVASLKDEVVKARETRRVELEQQLEKLRRPSA